MYCNLEAERARKNLSQEELAKQLGISRKTYFTWQKTEKIPSDKLAYLAGIFNCSVDYLMGLSDERQRRQ